MTQEEKSLLLQDLCARLPYEIFVKENRESLDDIPTIYTFDYHPCIDNCKPYLRPMSSMTEEEKFEYDRILSIEHEGYLLIEEVPDIIDFYNSKHLDYRGLIPMGLALEAPEGMYKK